MHPQKTDSLTTLDLVRIDDINKLNGDVIRLYSYLFFISNNFKNISDEENENASKLNRYIIDLYYSSLNKKINYSSIKVEHAVEKEYYYDIQEDIKENYTEQEKDAQKDIEKYIDAEKEKNKDKKKKKEDKYIDNERIYQNSKNLKEVIELIVKYKKSAIEREEFSRELIRILKETKSDELRKKIKDIISKLKNW